MTLLGQLVVYFPIVHFLIIAWTFLLFVEHPSALTISWLMFCTYLVPPLLYRLYSFGRPVHAARLVLNRREHCHWWIAHQMQMLYAAVPAFEALLRLVPGLYSAWLRLWGSTVGKRVYWTPCVEIIDRHMLAIGDDVIFGHRVVCSSHAITKR